MTKDQLEEFMSRLEGAEGCNFRYDSRGEVTWNCKGGHNQELAARILLAMGIRPEERKGFLDKCTEYGGHCDCEILFNAAEQLMDEYELSERIPNPKNFSRQLTFDRLARSNNEIN